MTDHSNLIKRLRLTAKQRATASATDKDKYLTIVARMSRSDAELMEEAANALEGSK